MIAVMLAAGRSSRFGEDKLDASLAGRPLVEHAADIIRKLPFRERIAVCSRTTHGLEELGFRCVMVDGQETPMSASLATGVIAAERLEATSIFIALADMPFITVDHVHALADLYDGSPVASCQDGKIMPPAIFPRSDFARLKSLTGDRGARDLLRGTRCVELQREASFDVDTQQDLAEAARHLLSRDARN